MKKKIILSSLTIGGIIAGGLLTSISAASNVKDDYKISSLINRKLDNSNANVQLNFSHFTQNAKIANMKIWDMKFDNNGKALNNSYQGVIVPIGTAINNNNIENLLINKTSATITWDKPYNANTKGIYTATINQGNSSFDFKIFVTGSSFDFPGVFHNKTLPIGFQLPNNVSNIIGAETDARGYQTYIFQHSKLNDDFKIPNSVTNIGEYGFAFSTLNDSFTIPNSVTSIGKDVFTHAIFNDDFAIPSSVTSIGEDALSYTRLPKGFTIPSSVTSIPIRFFERVVLNDDFTIPSSVTSIGDSAFRHATLNDSFTIPSSVTSIGKNAFNMVILNDDFAIPSSVISIGEEAFEFATLNDSFTIPSSVTSIGDGAFNNVTLNDDFKIPSSITSIGPLAFIFATLNDSFTIPSSVTSIGDNAFKGATLNDSFTIPSNVTSVGNNAFKESDIRGYHITNSTNINSLNENFETIKSVINIIKKFIKDSNNHNIFKGKYNFNHNFSNDDLFNLLKSKYDPTNNKTFSPELINHFILKTKYDKSNFIISFLPSLGGDVYIPSKYFKPKAKIIATNDDFVKTSEISAETEHNIYVSKAQNKSWYEEVSLLKNIDNTKEKWFKVEIDRINNKNNSKNHAFTLDELKTRTGDENNFEKQKTYAYVKLDSNTKDQDVAYKTDLINNNYSKTNAEIKWIKTGQTWDLKLFYKNNNNLNGEDDSIYRYKITETSKEDIIKDQKAYNQKDKIVAVNDDLGDKYTKEFFTETSDQVYVSTVGKKDFQEEVSLIKTFAGDKEKLFKVEINRINNSNNWSRSPFTMNDLKIEVNNEKNFEKQKTFFYTTLNSNTKDQDIVYQTNFVNKGHGKFPVQVKWIKTGQTWDLKLFYTYPKNISGKEDDAIHRFKTIEISKEDTIKDQNAYNQKDKIVVVNDDLLDKYTKEFFTETNDHVYFSTILKSYNEEGVSLIKFFPNDKAKLFKVEIDRINNSNNNKSSPFTFDEVKAKISDDNNYDKAKEFVYAAWDSNTKDQDIVFETDLINAVGRKFHAQVKWIKTGQTWDLKLFYTFPSNWPSQPGEDDSIYKYKIFDESPKKVLDFVKNFPIPTKNDQIHDEKKYKVIIDTKNQALKIIKDNNSQINIKDLSSSSNEFKKVKKLIASIYDYKKSIGTDASKQKANNEIDKITSQVALINGATEPKTEKTAFDAAVTKAKKAITDAANIDDVNSAKASGVTTVTSARDALDGAITQANLAHTKQTALQAIDDIKSQKTLVTGATEPVTERTAFETAVTKAKKAITDATSVDDVNSAETSGATTVTAARDALDSAIEASNDAYKNKALYETQVNNVKEGDFQYPIIDHKKLPSKIVEPQDQTISNDIKVSFKISTYDDKTGSILWKATVSKGYYKKVFLKTLTAYQTKSEAIEALKAFNKKSKIIVINDNSKDKKKEIYVEEKDNIYVAKKYNVRAEIEAKLLKNILLKPNEEKIFKIQIDSIKNQIATSTTPFTLDQIKMKTSDENNYASKEIKFIKLNSKTYSYDNVIDKIFRDAANVRVLLQIKWVKSGNGFWDLNIVYDNPNHPYGRSDTIKRFKASILSKEDVTGFIKKITIPPQNNKIHDEGKYNNIIDVINNALKVIQKTDSSGALYRLASSPINGTEVAKILKAIQEYNDSTGTIVAKQVAAAKIAALQAIDDIKSQKTLVTDATEPTSKKTAFAAAIAKAKKLITDATSFADVNSAKASGVTTVTAARDALNSAIEAANQAKVASDLAEAKATALQAIDDVKSQKTLVTGATEPTTEKTAFENAVTKAKQAITDATNVADVNSAKASGVTTITAARDALDSAIEAANQAKVASDLAEAKATALQAIDDVKSQKTLVTGATEPTTKKTAFETAVTKAKQAITDATNVADVNSAKTSDVTTVTAARDALDSAIEAANQAKVASDLADARTTALQAIDDIKSQKTLVTGATEPTSEKTAFETAVTKAKQTITDATNVADVNSAKTSDVTTVIAARDALDSAIEAANQAKVASDLADARTTALQAIDDVKSQKTLVTGATEPTTKKTAFETAVTKAKKAITDATNVADVNSAKTNGVTTVTDARDVLDGAIKKANDVKASTNLASAKQVAVSEIDDIKNKQTIVPGTTEPTTEKTAFETAITKAKKAITDATNVADVNSAKADGVTTVTAARDALDSAIEAANQAKVASDLADARTTALQAIDDIKSQKTLVTGATEPTTEKTAFENAVTKAKQTITDATNVADVNSAKTSGVTTITAARDAFDSAIEAANQAKVASDLADARTTALQAIDDVKSPTTLNDGANDPKTERTTFTKAVTQAKQAVNDAVSVEDVMKAKNAGVLSVTAARNTLNTAIGAANQAKAASDLADARTTALQAIDDVKSQKTLVTGATEPTTKKTAFETAVTKAKQAITDATNVADVNSAKTSGVSTVTDARDALDSAIETANWNKEISEVKTISLNLPKEIKTKLPSSIVKPKNIILPSDIQVTYKTWKPNDKEGTIAWEVIISKGKISKTLSGTLNNYKTSQEAKQEALKNEKVIANKEINAIDSKTKLISGANLLNGESENFKKSIKNALEKIAKAKTVVEVKEILNKQKSIIKSLRDTLDGAIKLANEKQKTKLVVAKIKTLTKNLERKTNDYIEPAPKGTILNAESFKSLADNSKEFLIDTTNFQITYSHKDMVESGILPVSLKVKNLIINEEKSIIFEVDVQGINKEKAMESKDIFLTKEKLEKFDHKVSNLKNRKEVLPSSLKNMSSPEGFGLKIPNDIPKDIRIDYSTKPNDKNGTLKVKALISEKKGTKREAIFTLEGFKKDIEKSKSLLSKYTIAVMASLGTIFLLVSGVILKIIRNKKAKGIRK